MTPSLILLCIAVYFFFLLLIALWTSRGAGSTGYYLGNKASPWYAVAFGLIGDSLSGVTFISVPGAVGKTQFSYLQVVMGYMVGYALIASVLLPLYYRMNLTSIYGYLRDRLGWKSQVTGAAFFLISRLLGSAARLYLAVTVLQTFVFEAWSIPFWVTTAAVIGLILLYTYRGGIKTLVWTDTFQSAFLLLGVVLSIAVILQELDLGWLQLGDVLRQSPHTRVLFDDWRSDQFFWKQFLSGVFLAVVMTGLDQNSMQKNLSCPSLKEAQKNLYWFGGVVVAVNALFLCLGALLYHYAADRGIAVPAQTDQLFPLLALRHLGSIAAVVFILGLTASTFSSADSVLTTLTTSLCLDVLGLDRRGSLDSPASIATRHQVHLLFAGLLLCVILAFRYFNSPAIIQVVLKLATYTYGPLLGMFAFGILSRRRASDDWVPWICLSSPVLCAVIDRNSAQWFAGYRFGFELLILNGALTAALLWATPKCGESGQRELR